jgi:ectoine hydroxylase-related dioxygenase (phytanoyl-CoA dioxygenase family)
VLDSIRTAVPKFGDVLSGTAKHINATCVVGDVLVMDERLIHRGTANTTTTNRRVLAFSFASGLGHHFEITNN